MNYKISSIKKLPVSLYYTFSSTVFFLLDKTELNQLESSYKELEQKYLLAVQVQTEYELLKEQLAEKQEKINELQNTINQETTG